jgi:nitrous oxidase accessory protein NosD
VGIVLDYFVKAQVAQIKIQDAEIKPGDTLQIHGKTTGVKEFVVESIRRDEEVVSIAERGTWVTVSAPRCRVGDKVFLMVKRFPEGDK